MGNALESSLSAGIEVRSTKNLKWQFLFDAEGTHPVGNVRSPGQYAVAAQNDVVLAEKAPVYRMEFLFQRRGIHLPIHVHCRELIKYGYAAGTSRLYVISGFEQLLSSDIPHRFGVGAIVLGLSYCR